MMNNHQQFFEKALAIQTKKQEKLTEAEKKEIAMALGFSEEDWKAVLQSFSAHLERGKAYLERQNFQEAIIEFQEALVIQPENTDALAQIAWAHLGVYQNKKNKSDKAKALQYAKECLQNAPSHPLAHQVIDTFNANKKQFYDIKSTQIHLPKAFSNSVKVKFIHFILYTMVIGATVGFFTILFLSIRTRYYPPKHIKSTNQRIPEEKPTTTTKPKSTQNPKFNTYEKNIHLPITLVSENEDYQMEAQTDSSFLVRNRAGQKLFQIFPHYCFWKIQEHTWSDNTWQGKSKYNLFAEGLCGIEVFAHNLYASIQFGAELLSANGNRFYSDFDRQMISTESMPDGLFFYPDQPTLFKFRLSVLRRGANFENDLPFKLNEKPTRLRLILKELRFGNPTYMKTLPIPVFYEGKRYETFAINQSGEASGYEPSDGIFAYRWALVIKHNFQNKKLRTLKVRVKFFDKQNREIPVFQESWSSEMVYEPDFPPLSAHKWLLRGFSHDLKRIKEASQIARKEIHIQEMAWD